MKIRKYIIQLAALFILVAPIGCTEFLSIEPEDRFLERSVFGSITSVHNAINGVYMNMAQTDSYGGDLTMITVDILAQYYNTTDNELFDELSDYDYAQQNPVSYFSSIWSGTYTNILNVNNFLSQLLETPETVIDTARKNILLGEAHALRAFLHFDLLRLYGPIYSENPTAEAIPYVTRASSDISSLLPANLVIDSIRADLLRAETYLLNDPVRTAGGFEAIEGQDAEEDFYRMRSRRMNYFAVLALQARVNLYAGDETNAQFFAQRVIDEATELFPWASPANSNVTTSNPDRIFSPEILFGIENTNLYARHDNYFSSALEPDVILTALPQRLSELFSNTNDFRYLPIWRTDQNSNDYLVVRTFYKFEEVNNTNVRFCQPLIRLSEMYYIMSECTGDAAYLNTVRFNRGLVDVAPASEAQLDTELRNEYRREFWGEGQTFFYFKRKNLASIPSGKTFGRNISMGPAQYTIPLPLSETNNR